jgi:hypothetical protein
MASARIELDPPTVEAVARRVVELLDRRGQSGGPELVDAAELARRFGIERSWVYTHAIELGGSRAWLRTQAAAALRSEPAPEPAFHEFASEWLETRRHEFTPRTVEDYELALTHHLLPFFKDHRLSEIAAQEVDRCKVAKVRERELGKVEQPLSNRTINKALTRLGQILDAAVRYELIEHNPVKGRVEKLKEAEPKRARLTGEQVQILLRASGSNRTLLATAIMAGWCSCSASTRWPRSGVSPTTSSSPAASERSRASATASAPASSTGRSRRQTNC